jgi:adenine phosphoribosyltransferase
MQSANDLRRFIRDVPDFPKPGIIFKDITPLLRDRAAFDDTIALMCEPFRKERVSVIAAIESRGFIFGSCMARALGTGFIPIRKPGKLPWTKRRNEYVLEYGSDALEIHDDALSETDRVLIVDDLLATGGTIGAASTLVRGFGATIVSLATVIELSFLEGRRKLPDVPFFSLIEY